MLIKLLKYDMKAGARMIPVIYAVIAGLYLTGLMAKALDIGQIKATTSVLLVIGGIAAVILTFVYVVLRFYKGLFGAEGYLWQTLPVGKGSHIISKMIAAYVWMVLSITVAVLSVLGVLYLNNAQDLGKWISTLFGSKFTPLVVFTVVTGGAQLLAFIGEIYFAITLSNTKPFIRNNILFSVLFFFAVNFVVGSLELLAMMFIPFGINITESGVEWTTEIMAKSLMFNMDFTGTSSIVGNMSFGATSGLADLLAGIALLLAARWLMEHKTSVK